MYKDNVAGITKPVLWCAGIHPKAIGVLHILIKLDQEVLDSYLAMVAAMKNRANWNDSEETTQKEEPGVVIEPVTIEQVEAAKKLVLDSQKTCLPKFN